MTSVLASLSLIFAAALASPSGGDGKRREPNPALVYWQGIALLPEMNKASEQLPMDVSGGRIPADSEQVKRFLSEAAPALKRFKRAAGSETACEWGITTDEGPYAVIPHLVKMQWMGRLALLQAEHDLVTGQPEKALEWVLVTHRAARHVGSDGMFATVLAEYNMEALALKVTGRHIARLDSNLRTGHRQQLEKLPPLHDVGHALQGERDIAQWLHRMLLGFENQPDVDQAMNAFLETLPKPAAGSPPGDAAQQQADALRLWLEEWRRNHEAIQAVFKQLHAACAKPWNEALKEIEQLQATPSLNMPAVQNLFPLLKNYLRKRHEVETQQRMLMAALTLGPEPALGNLPQWRDAFFDEPLVVRKEEGVLVIGMRQPVGSRHIVLRLSPLSPP